MNSYRRRYSLPPYVPFVIVTLLTSAISGCGANGGDGNSPLSGSTSSAAVGFGCYSVGYQNFGPNNIGAGLLATSGNVIFDQRFGQEIGLQSAFWSGLPTTVYLFNEGPGTKNAVSLPQRFILVGINLVNDAIISTGSDLPIAGVLAHEWGHQAQFTFGWMNAQTSTVRPTELEADAFSGYYMAMAKGWAGPQLNTYFNYLFLLGDYQFNDPGHHGTPNERVAAGTLGLSVANQALQTNNRMSYQQLHAVFSSAIKSTVLMEPPDEPNPDFVVASAINNIDHQRIRKIRDGTEGAETISAPPSTPQMREALWPR
jgi:hypothetical protein